MVGYTEQGLSSNLLDDMQACHANQWLPPGDRMLWSQHELCRTRLSSVVCTLFLAVLSMFIAPPLSMVRTPQYMLNTVRAPGQPNVKQPPHSARQRRRDAEPARAAARDTRPSEGAARAGVQTRVGRLAALCKHLAGKGQRHWPVVATTVVGLAAALTAAGRNWTAVTRALDRAIATLATQPAVSPQSTAKAAGPRSAVARTLTRTLATAGPWVFAAAVLGFAGVWASAGPITSRHDEEVYSPKASSTHPSSPSTSSLDTHDPVVIKFSGTGRAEISLRSGSRVPTTQLFELIKAKMEDLEKPISTWILSLNARELAEGVGLDPSSSKVTALSVGETRQLDSTHKISKSERRLRTEPFFGSIDTSPWFFVRDVYGNWIGLDAVKSFLATAFAFEPGCRRCDVYGDDEQDLQTFLGSMRDGMRFTSW
jgi:hypothetical protein